MANQIRMTPDAMRSRANEYRIEASNVESVIHKMDNLLTQLQSEWEGKASESYADRYAALRPSFVAAYDLINEIAKSLDESARIMGETDDAIANAFKG